LQPIALEALCRASEEVLVRVLVATDLSEEAELALREGAEIARSTNDALGLVHVLPPLQRESLFFPVRDTDIADKAAAVLERTKVRMRELVERVAPRADIFIDEGTDHVAICRRASDFRADLIVVGSHAHSGISRFVMDVATHVVAEAPCSVLVARPHPTRGPVIVATDLSHASMRAVTVAAQEARRRKAPLEVVRARRFVDLELAYLVQITPAIRSRMPESDSMPTSVRELLGKQHMDADWSELDGPAGSAIIRRAESVAAELVVVGTRGGSALSRAHVGHIATKVARDCTRSVLVVRAGVNEEPS